MEFSEVAKKLEKENFLEAIRMHNLLADRKLFKAALHDCLPMYQKERRFLENAYDAGIFHVVISHNGFISREDKQSLAKILNEEYGTEIGICFRTV